MSSNGVVRNQIGFGVSLQLGGWNAREPANASHCMYIRVCLLLRWLFRFFCLYSRSVCSSYFWFYETHEYETLPAYGAHVFMHFSTLHMHTSAMCTPLFAECFVIFVVVVVVWPLAVCLHATFELHAIRMPNKHCRKPCKFQRIRFWFSSIRHSLPWQPKQKGRVQ